MGPRHRAALTTRAGATINTHPGTVLRHDAAVNPIFLYVLSLIMTVILLAVVGAGFLGWVFGLLFIPFIVTVIAMTVID